MLFEVVVNAFSPIEDPVLNARNIISDKESAAECSKCEDAHEYNNYASSDIELLFETLNRKGKTHDTYHFGEDVTLGISCIDWDR